MNKSGEIAKITSVNFQPLTKLIIRQTINVVTY